MENEQKAIFEHPETGHIKEIGGTIGLFLAEINAYKRMGYREVRPIHPPKKGKKIDKILSSEYITHSERSAYRSLYRVSDMADRFSMIDRIQRIISERESDMREMKWRHTRLLRKKKENEPQQFCCDSCGKKLIATYREARDKHSWIVFLECIDNRRDEIICPACHKKTAVQPDWTAREQPQR